MKRGRFFKLLLGGGAASAVPEALVPEEVYEPPDGDGDYPGTTFRSRDANVMSFRTAEKQIDFKWAKDGSMWLERDGQMKKLI